jgi:His-Xaa-Ser system radical SAM maturase HxsB
LANGDALLVSDNGRFFASDASFLERMIGLQLTESDHQFLEAEGHAWDANDALLPLAHAHSVAQRFAVAKTLDYLVLVPTLRCNLSCTYCQVSRASIDRPEYDWSETTLGHVLNIIDGLTTDFVKIEFQGGEPTLRPDLLRRVIDRAQSGRDAEFVVCTNLSQLTPEILEIFDNPNVYISTSLDGDADTHRTNRTKTDGLTSEFERNLDVVLDRYGSKKVSALPTINSASPPEPQHLIDAYVSRGLTSIYLRPINFQGFARKRHPESIERTQNWRIYYEAFVRKLIERNWSDRSVCVDETYLTLCLNRIFRPGLDRHVDLRNPNPVGVDYVVIDYDGQVYPTDEARMLSRSGVVDLAIGDVASGWDTPQRELLNRHATNTFDEDCSRCAFQPYCGRDIIDDLSRYGRVDLPRTATAFCRRHLHLFDFIFELIYSNDEATQYSLACWLQLPIYTLPPVRHS